MTIATSIDLSSDRPIPGRVARRARRVATALGCPLALILIWALASRAGWLTEQILPAPAIVWAAFLDMVRDGTLWTQTVVSLRRVGLGFAAGVLFGLPIGIGFGVSPVFSAFVAPVIRAITQVNAMAWIPLLVLFLGIDEGLKIVVIGWSASTPIILSTARGIAGVSSHYRELGRALDLGRLDTLRLIVVPASLPAIFAGLREALAVAWQTLVIVELFASFEGLGYLMAWGRQLFQLELVLVAMAVIGAIGLLLSFAVDRIARWAQPWAAEQVS